MKLAFPLLVIAGGLDQLGLAAAALDVADDDPGQVGEEREALVAVARLPHHEQLRVGAVRADERGEWGGGLTGQEYGHEDERVRGEVHVADGRERNGLLGREGFDPGQGSGECSRGGLALAMPWLRFS